MGQRLLSTIYTMMKSDFLEEVEREGGIQIITVKNKLPK